MGFVPVLVFSVILFVVVARLFAGSMNHKRIGAYFHERGCEVQSIDWEPWGPGWFGDKGTSSCYRVRYRDAEGATRETFCRTGMTVGVFHTDDKLLASAPPKPPAPASAPSLAEDNARLIEENRRLRDLLKEKENNHGP